MDYPRWLLPTLPAEPPAIGTPREPHIIYDEADEIELARLAVVRAKRHRSEPQGA